MHDGPMNSEARIKYTLRPLKAVEACEGESKTRAEVACFLPQKSLLCRHRVATPAWRWCCLGSMWVLSFRRKPGHVWREGYLLVRTMAGTGGPRMAPCRARYSSSLGVSSCSTMMQSALREFKKYPSTPVLKTSQG